MKYGIAVDTLWAPSIDIFISDIAIPSHATQVWQLAIRERAIIIIYQIFGVTRRAYSCTMCMHSSFDERGLLILSIIVKMIRVNYQV